MNKLKIEISRERGISFLVPDKTRLSLLDTDRIKEVCEIASENCLILALDLSGVKRIDSAVLGTLVSIHNGLSVRRGNLILIGPGPEIQNLLATTHLDSVLKTMASQEQVIKSFAG